MSSEYFHDYRAEIILDSISTEGHRLTTMEVTFPRIILAEFNTHRQFSRNSASSRALSAKHMIEWVRNDPFIPEFTLEQKGMSGAPYPDELRDEAHDEWLGALDDALRAAEQLVELGVHKQHVNRLLEPFMWQTVLVSATEWDNFFKLRCANDAQPEMQKIAGLMRKAQEASTPAVRVYHAPFVLYPLDLGTLWGLISAARCARLSYLTQRNPKSEQDEIAFAKKLWTSGHFSPFEHVAIAHSGGSGNFSGWLQARLFMEEDSL